MAWAEPKLAERLFQENARHEGIDDDYSLEALYQDRRECHKAWLQAEVGDRAAALAMWSVTYLHLFSDGNGRTARGLAYAILAQTGAVILSAEQFHLFHARTVAILEPLLCLSA